VLRRVASFATIEDAEDAGRRLVTAGIPTKLDGAVGRHGSVELLVDRADFDRARDILDDLPEKTGGPAEPFHACPACGTDDPRWMGYRKVLLLAAAVASWYVLRSSPYLFYFAGAEILVFAVLAWNMSEFECRKCGHRWIKEHRSERS